MSPESGIIILCIGWLIEARGADIIIETRCKHTRRTPKG
jgi:hypothetical protein